MTAYSMTIANTFSVFGGAPTDHWSAWTWNNFAWGDGTSDLGITLEKWLNNDLTPDSAMGLGLQKGISESLSMDSDRDNAYLYDGDGYLYVEPGPVTDHDDELSNIFSEAARPSSGFSKDSRPSTTWSES